MTSGVDNQDKKQLNYYNMNDKERFELYSKQNIIKITPEERIKQNINTLIDALYIPFAYDKCNDKKMNDIIIVDLDRLDKFHINPKESIFWEHFRCISVVKSENAETFEVLIDFPVANKSCESFKKYITSFMKNWGWDVIVEIE